MCRHRSTTLKTFFIYQLGGVVDGEGLDPGGGGLVDGEGSRSSSGDRWQVDNGNNEYKASNFSQFPSPIS